jgi:hypothetical protein
MHFVGLVYFAVKAVGPLLMRVAPASGGSFRASRPKLQGCEARLSRLQITRVARAPKFWRDARFYPRDAGATGDAAVWDYSP